MINVGIKKLRNDLIIPTYATDGASGMDIYLLDDIIIFPGHQYFINCGFALDIPDNCEIQIRPKSGLAKKYNLTIVNTPGTIDNDYKGEIGIILYRLSEEAPAATILRGTKIAQMVLCPILRANLIEVNDVGTSQRNDKGFGSNVGYN